MKWLEDLNNNIIWEFRGRYNFLSNFYIHPSIKFNSVECYYQSCKEINHQDGLLYANLTPEQAKRKGNSIKLRSDWEEIKVSVMYKGVLMKFDQFTLLKDKLLSTKNNILIEGNNWGDEYWGVNLKTGEGMNMLGRILMDVRGYLRVENSRSNIKYEG